MTNPLDAWIVELANALALDANAIDRNLILDVAGDAAHGVSRPAAPLTTFLVGLAAGHRGADAAAIRTAAETARLLAQTHENERTETDRSEHRPHRE